MALAAGTAGADERPYYKWVDRNGVLNISQDKPRGKVGVVEVPADEPQVMSRRPGHMEPGGTSGVGDNDAAAREINCSDGRLALERLNAHKYIFMRDKDGWWRKITPDQRDAQVRKFKRLVADNCPES